MFDTSSIVEIKDDFNEITKNSIKVELNKYKIKWYEKLVYLLISIFSPLL
jgi:hypothetical protein